MNEVSSGSSRPGRWSICNEREGEAIRALITDLCSMMYGLELPIMTYC